MRGKSNGVNIYLVGFMGTGKTEIAKELAKRLSRKFVEMDEAIEKREKRSITEIFRINGEDYFRKVEKEIVEDISKRNNLAVSCGGGVVLNEDNIKNLKKSGIVICLWANPDVIYKRVKGQTHRPLLNVDHPRERIKELLDARKTFYDKSDYKIDTSILTIQEVAGKIVSLINKRQKTPKDPDKSGPTGQAEDRR